MNTNKNQIELAKRLIESGISDTCRKMLELEFPELKESEDERIRKRLIDCLKLSLKGAEEQDAAGCSRYKDIEAYKWGIAYLEKHKEQKPSTEEIELNSIAFLKHTCFPPIAMPAEKQDYSGLNDLERVIHRGFLSAGVENVPVTIIKETAQECLAQMKPTEWSDEDKKMLEDIISILIEGRKCETDEGIISDFEDKIHFLGNRFKLLPQRYNPHCHWKPTEVQMNMLDTIQKYVSEGSGYWGNFLKEFIDEIKNLM